VHSWTSGVTKISGVATSIFRDGAYVGELWDNFGEEVVETTLVLQKWSCAAS
jgi:hypothetical protein